MLGIQRQIIAIFCFYVSSYYQSSDSNRENFLVVGDITLKLLLCTKYLLSYFSWSVKRGVS